MSGQALFEWGGAAAGWLATVYLVVNALLDRRSRR